MLKEILTRRLKHYEWPLPDLILIDGGKAQVSAAEKALKENNIKISVVGIAKGLKRRQDKFIIGKRGLAQKPCFYEMSERSNFTSGASIIGKRGNK